MENHESKKIQSLVGRNKPKSTNNNIGSIFPNRFFPSFSRYRQNGVEGLGQKKNLDMKTKKTSNHDVKILA